VDATRRRLAVTEGQRDCVVTTLGAVAGAVAGYLFFTERGRALRHQMLPALDELERELNHFRGTISRTAGIAAEGWRVLNEAIGEPPSAHRTINPHQTIPF
jgi:hypothetical protein